MNIEQIQKATEHASVRSLLEAVNSQIPAGNKHLTAYQIRQLKNGDNAVSYYAIDTVSKYFEGTLGE